MLLYSPILHQTQDIFVFRLQGECGHKFPTTVEFFLGEWIWITPHSDLALTSSLSGQGLAWVLTPGIKTHIQMHLRFLSDPPNLYTNIHLDMQIYSWIFPCVIHTLICNIHILCSYVISACKPQMSLFFISKCNCWIYDGQHKIN